MAQTTMSLASGRRLQPLARRGLLLRTIQLQKKLFKSTTMQ